MSIMMFRRWVLPAAALVAIAAVLLTPAALSTSFRAYLERLRQGAEEAKGDDQLHRELVVEVDGLRRQIEGVNDSLVSLDTKREEAAARVGRLQQRKQDALGVLRRADALLARPGESTFEIGSKSYSRLEVEADARLRLADVRGIEKELDAARTTHSTLAASATSLRRDRDAAASLARGKLAEADVLRARLEGVRMAAHVHALESDLRDVLGGPAAGVARAEEALRRRVAQASHEAEDLGPSKGLVTWPEDDATAQELREELAQVLATE